MNKIKAIIIGTSHHNTLSIIRALGLPEINTSVLIYGCRKSFISHSKLIKEILFFEDADDVISYLKKSYTSVTNKPIIISCTDEIAHKLDIKQTELTPYMHFFHTATAGDLTLYMDKFKQVELAKKVGFKVPWSSVYDDNFDIKSIVYPCILKPLASINGGKHICICNSYEEFKLSINAFEGVKTIIQEMVTKDEEIVIVGLTVDGHSHIPAYISKIREIKGGTTYSKVCDIKRLPSQIIEICKRMITDIGYEGLWGIECIVKGDEFYFLELNLRNDATTYSIVKAGANLPYAYIVGKMGQPIEVFGPINEIYSIVEHNDFICAMKHHIGVVKWYKCFKQANCRYLFQRGDLGPGVSILRQYISLVWKKFIGKK